ncbi:MAG: hypothetical protein ACREAE_07075, partial [Nitrosopumilaceae archaeon]
MQVNNIILVLVPFYAKRSTLVISAKMTMFIQQNRVFYYMRPIRMHEIYQAVKVGIVAGLIGGFVILV